MTKRQMVLVEVLKRQMVLRQTDLIEVMKRQMDLTEMGPIPTFLQLSFL